MFLTPKRSRVLTRRPRGAASQLRLDVLEDRTVPAAGALDTAFGAGGLVTTDFIGSRDDRAEALRQRRMKEEG